MPVLESESRRWRTTAPQGWARAPLEESAERLNAVLWVLRTGAPWADLPERYPFLPDLPSPSAVDLAGFGQPMLRLSTE